MSTRFRPVISARVRALVDRLTLRQLLLQVTTPALVHLDRARLDGYGGIFLHGTTVDERAEIIARMQPACPVPPFVVADIEAGPSDTPRELDLGFGCMLSHGLTDDPTLTRTLGETTGRLSRAHGFHWALGPCVDLLADRDSPMVSTRSAGRDPRRVARITSAFAAGLQAGGLVATAKHFPGDGFGTYDQHLTTVVNPLDGAAWRAGPGAVFQQLIDDGVMAIMPGHIALPALDTPEPGLGLHPPATLSRRLLTDVLRGELGFAGLIVSDAVNMTGFCGFVNYYDACARFLEAGGDMLLFAKVDEYFLREMERCLRNGRLSEATLRDRAARIVAVKEGIGLLDPTPLPTIDVAALRLPALAERLAASSVGVLRDRRGLLPLSITRATRVLHVVAYNEFPQHRERLEYFTALLREHSDDVVEWVDPGCDRLFVAARDREFDLIVCSVGGSVQYGTNVVRLHGPVARNLMYGWMRLGTPTVFVAHHHPFIHREFEAAVDCAVATCNSTRYSLRHLVGGLIGRHPLRVLDL